MEDDGEGTAGSDGVCDGVFRKVGVEFIETLVAEDESASGLEVGGIDEEPWPVVSEVGEGEAFSVASEEISIERSGEDVGGIPVGGCQGQGIPGLCGGADDVGAEGVRELALDVAGVPEVVAVEAVVGSGEATAADGGDVIDSN